MPARLDFFAPIAALSFLTFLSSPNLAHGSEKKPGRKSGTAVLPADASEGPRQLEVLPKPLTSFVRAQPYGKKWKDIVHVDPAPKNQTGLSAADTHRALSNDEIELQAQSQFLESTNVEVRYGFVSVRGVRVYKYGRLTGVQLVLYRVGRGSESKAGFKKDIAALQKDWADLPGRLGLGKGMEVVRNDLVEGPKKSPETFPSSPLRIELEPVEAN